MKSLGKLNSPKKKKTTYFILTTFNHQVLGNEYFGNWVQLAAGIILDKAIIQIRVILTFRHCW